MCTQAFAPRCSPPGVPVLDQDQSARYVLGRCNIRRLFSRQISHVGEAELPQPAQIHGVTNAPPVTDASFAGSGDQTFSLQRLDVRVDLSVVHADALCDISRRLAVRALGQIPDDGCPQGVGIEHVQGFFSLERLSGKWLVNAGHPSILTHRLTLMQYQHLFGDGSIMLKMLLVLAGAHRKSREGELP